jgi:hypothetical protein
MFIKMLFGNKQSISIVFGIEQWPHNSLELAKVGGIIIKKNKKHKKLC